MSTVDPKDPWSTGDRAGYAPPKVEHRYQPPKQGINVGSLLRTVLVIVALLWAFNYVWQHYYLPNK